MTVVPVAVLLFIVVVALGGPTNFVNTLSNWGGDVASFVAGFLKSL